MGDQPRMSVSLSRRQLAAALLEYDNDPEDDLAPRVDARDSALFLPFRPHPPPPPSLSLPHHLEDAAHERTSAVLSPGQGRRSISFGPDERRSSQLAYRAERSSKEMERRDEVIEDEEDEDELLDQDHVEEIDVSRWNLPSHLLSTSEHKPVDLEGAVSTSRPSSRLDHLSRPADLTTLRTRSVLLLRPEPEVSPTSHARAMSVHLDISGESLAGDIGGGGEIDEVLSRAERIRLLAENGEEGLEELADDSRRRRLSGESYRSRRISTDRARRMSNPMMVPLPPSPATYARPMSSLSEAMSTYDRPHSRPELDGTEEDETPNPFALPAPPMAQASRFDPKALHAQRQSISSMLDIQPPTLAERPISMLSAQALSQLPQSPLRPAPDSTRSRIYPEMHNPPLPDNIKVYDDIPSPSEYGKPLRASRYGPPLPRPNRQSILRPSNLVMPAPLAGAERPTAEYVPDGWTIGEKPLPPGSRTSVISIGDRPRLPMSLSSRMFRSSLMVNGVRDDDWIGGAEVDGEVGVEGDDVLAKEERHPGKLFGTSLMDQLEARKAHMRGKQRVFTGDSRPAMMARPTSYMSAGQPDPSSATAEKSRPTSTAPRGPLLQFDTNGDLIPADSGVVRDSMPRSRSLLGVDQIWEKELAKLKIMEAEAEKQRAMEEQKERDRKEAEGRKKRKGKGKTKAIETTSTTDPPLYRSTTEESKSPVPLSPIRATPAAPPTLQYLPDKEVSAIDYFEQRSPPKEPSRTASRMILDQWENSSDEEETVQHRASKPKAKTKAPQPRDESSDDEEENVPLSRLAPPRLAPDSDSEEDVPLSKIAHRSPISTISPSATQCTVGIGHPSQLARNEEHGCDDDDVPLMLHRARAQTLTSLEGAQPSNVEEIEDDLPLGYKHAEAAQRQMMHQSTSTASIPPMGDWWASRASSFGAFNGYPMAPPPMYTPMVMGPMAMSPMGMPMPMSDPYGMGYPTIPPWGGGPAMLPPPPGPENNIDRWRREIRTPSVVTGASAAHSGSR